MIAISIPYFSIRFHQQMDAALMDFQGLPNQPYDPPRVGPLPGKFGGTLGTGGCGRTKRTWGHALFWGEIFRQHICRNRVLCHLESNATNSTKHSSKQCVFRGTAVILVKGKANLLGVFA